MFAQSSCKTFIFSVSFLILLSFCGFAEAQERLIKGAPASLTPLPTPGAVQREDANLIVSDVMIDRTADNAVQAREQAMTEARRVAFQRLAEKNLTPAAYATFRMPDDRTIATLVQDFEIKGEQLSSTRYVASFTVRFREAVRNYINIPQAVREVTAPATTPSWRQMPGDQSAVPGEGTVVIDGAADGAAQTVPFGQAAQGQQPAPQAQYGQAQAAATPRVNVPVLLLPYYENMAGKTVLWDDVNPWRDTWQRMPMRGAGVSAQLLNKIVVPLGDIADVSAGSVDAVWSGNYATVEKLRRNYGVEKVVLAVANKSGPQMSIDIYFYEGGKLKRRSSLTPYVGEKSDAEAWQQAMYDVLGYLQRPAPAEGSAVESISRSVVNPAAQTGAQPNRPSLVTAPYDPSASAAAASPYAQVSSSSYPAPYSAGAAGQEVEAILSFSDFSTWMNVQRRFSAMSPPVRIDIRSLSRNNARFVMRYDGSVPGLQSALAAQGIVMSPSREVTTAYGTPVYDLRLH